MEAFMSVRPPDVAAGSRLLIEEVSQTLAVSSRTRTLVLLAEASIIIVPCRRRR